MGFVHMRFKEYRSVVSAYSGVKLVSISRESERERTDTLKVVRRLAHVSASLATSASLYSGYNIYEAATGSGKPMHAILAAIGTAIALRALLVIRKTRNIVKKLSTLNPFSPEMQRNAGIN